MSSASRNPDPRQLPPGWITQYDKNYDAWYYVNTAANPPVTTWEHPAKNAYSAPPGPPPGPPQYNQGGQNQGYYNQGGYNQQPPQQQYYQQSPPPQQYVQQQGYNDRGPAKSGGGLLGKLLGGGSKPSSSSYGGGYGPGPGYGGGGYGPGPGYYGQQPMYGQPQKSGGGMGMGGLALAAGGGLLGGMLIEDAIDDAQENAYAEGYNDAADGGGFDGDF